MNNNIESVKSKIKKLLALSEDNPSDAESYAALQKAQELMAQYKLDKMDLTDEEKKSCIKRKTMMHYGSRSSDRYMSELANVIAENFCCINYLSRIRGTQTNYICFMGMEDDVDIAEEALRTANDAIQRGCNRLYKRICKENYMDDIPARYFNPLKVGYTDGYIAGLRDVFREQRKENQEWGLVLVVPQEAQDYLAGLEGRDFSDQIVDHSFYGEGYKDGKNFQLMKKVEGSNNNVGLIK